MSGSSDPSQVLADAMAGIHRRGEQDDMLKREVALPGFGGFYIDSSDRMVVYMKPSSNKSTAMVRAVLATAYANRKEPRVREVMSRISEMRVIDGEFSLSELIAGENRLAYSTTIIPGYVGVGVSLANNRLVLGLKDRASIDPARRVAMSLGVPADMLVIEVWGEVITTGKWTDRWRPGRAGIVIRIANGQFNSIAAEVESHGFTVKQVSTGATYFMSAAHGRDDVDLNRGTIWLACRDR